MKLKLELVKRKELRCPNCERVVATKPLLSKYWNVKSLTVENGKVCCGYCGYDVTKTALEHGFVVVIPNDQVKKILEEILAKKEEKIMREVEKRTGRRDILKATILGLFGLATIGRAKADIDFYPDRIEIDGERLVKESEVMPPATRVIAASDSIIKKGHYICDGVDDHAEINQAIQDLG